MLGADIRRSVLSRNCVINSGAVIEECIIGQGVDIGENCRLRKVIVDAHNKIAAGTSIGFDAAADAEKYFRDPDSGVTVIGMPKIQLRKNLQIPGAYENIFRSPDEMGF